MADHHSTEGASSSDVRGEGSESTVELNIKTLDSQIYSFHVNKNMPVSLFKEKIASEIGLPVGQQRLIFRGKVLKDEHLLSEYHVESGHTLHLVARQPSQPPSSSNTSSGDLNTNNVRGQDASAGGPRIRAGPISHSVVLGTLNVGDQGEGIMPDLNRVIGAVLNSFGVGNLTTNGSIGITQPNVQAPQGNEAEGTRSNVGMQNRTGSQAQAGQAFPSQPQVLQIPLGAAISIPSLNSPIPDSLTTLSEFISRMEQALSQNAYLPTQPPSNGDLPTVQLPTDTSGNSTPLSTVLRQAQRLLSGHAVAALSHIAGRLEQEMGSTDNSVRNQIQTESMQVGVAVQHLGALLLELGRTMLTLRMGNSPGESYVNAGPAVYISPSGPNPIMVQPFPLQASSLFGGSTTAAPSIGTSGPVGIGNPPRHVNIHIHTAYFLNPAFRYSQNFSDHPEVRYGLKEVIKRLEPDITNQAKAMSEIKIYVDARGEFGQPLTKKARTTDLPAVGTRVTNGEGVHGERANGPGSGDSGQTRVLPVRNVIATAIPPRPPISVSSASQSGVPVTQPLPDSAALSTVVADLNSHIRNFVDNMRSENQTPAEQSSTVQNQERMLPVNGAGESPSLPGDVHGREEQKIQPQHQSSNSEDTVGVVNSEEVVSSISMAGSHDSSGVETTLKTADYSESAPRSGLGNDNSEGATAIPLGLGLGGLQPKRRSRQPMSQGRSSDGGTSNPNQQTRTNEQQVLQSLASLANRTNGNTTSSSRQLAPSAPLGVQGPDGQLDVASAMSQVLHAPALNGLLAGVSQQTGIGSPDVLRNMLEQFTQSPGMMNTVNQIAQQVDTQDLGNMFSGLGRGQGGGFDLSRMVQQMMPIVSQALGGAAITQSGPTEGPEPPYNERSSRDLHTNDQNSQIDLQRVTQRIQQQNPPEDVFRSMVESAVRLYDGGPNTEDLLDELCLEEGLASEFMETLRRDIYRRLQGES